MYKANRLETISTSYPFHLKHPEYFSRFITQSPKMYSIFSYIETISHSTETVLITGESGTGKELIAEAIHKASGRRGEFIAFNVAGLDDFIFTDTLFGHSKGAFTGAENDRQGLVDKASFGTLFLDEIGDTSWDSQQKLLRLLETREYLPLGRDIPRTSNARVVVATNKNMSKLIKEKKFRHDLYYRLDLHTIHLPPLRDRKEDIPLLIDFFVEEAAIKNSKQKPKVPRSIYELLAEYNYPGNIRRLRSLIFDAVITNEKDELSPNYFIAKLACKRTTDKSSRNFSSITFPEVLPSLKKMELLLLEEALKRTRNNLSKAARLLRISRQTAYKLKKALEKH